MMLTEEQRLIRETARAFATEKLAPRAAEFEAAESFPPEILKELGALGFLGMLVPEDYGGVGSDHVAYAMALEEIAAGCGALSTLMSGHNSVGCMPILQYGTAEQKERFLPALARGEMLSCFCLTEPQGGSDASNLQTRARREGDTYVIDGTKQFITTGKIADLALVFATTDAAAGPKGISAFIVPTDLEGYVVARLESKMGQRASDTCQIDFRGLVVPAALRLGEEGEGYRIALANLEGGRIGIAAQAVGMARAALDAARAYALERVTFGKPIIEHQAVAFRLADMATRVEAGRRLVHYAARLRDAGQRCLAEASMAKLFATEMAERVCSDAIQTFGGYGYVEDFPVARIYRDVRVAKIYEGTNDIQKLVIARELSEQVG